MSSTVSKSIRSLIACAILCLAAPAFGQFRVVGYLPEYRAGAIHESWGKHLTDIICFSIEPKASGEIDTSKLKIDAVKKLRALAPEKKLRILICLGGWGRSKGFGPMATNATSRGKFIRNLTKLCLQHGFAGADFDWEFPKGKREENAYSTLLVETKAAFRKNRLLVTVAVGHNKRLSPEAYKAVDYVHLMSYDHGVKHATYADSVADVKRHLEFGVPAKKLCLGVPFYGRNMKNRNDARTYADIVKKHKPSANADEAGGVYFNGIETIRAKTRYALQNKLGGIMIWELGQDTFDATSLLRTIDRTVSGAKQKGNNAARKPAG